MNLFAEGSKNNPNEEAKEKQEKFQAWQQDQNEKLAKEQAEYLAQRTALMATMTTEEWDIYLKEEMAQNIKKFSNMAEYELN